jgi:hypothetical protein
MRSVIRDIRGEGSVANPGAAEADLALQFVLVKRVKERLSDYLHFPKWYSAIAVLRPYNVISCC